MAKRTGFKQLALWALVGGGTLLAGSAQAAEIKQGFPCRIELPPDFIDHLDTTDSVKVCADGYISITCRAELGPDQHPSPLVQGVDCLIQGAPCGLSTEQPVQAVELTFKTDAAGKARLSCLFRR